MKKLLLTFSLAAMLLSAKAQIIITGAMFDPRGLDAPANNAANPNYAAYSHKGGYEYMQFMATRKLQVGEKFCVVRSNSNTGTTGASPNGWSANSSPTDNRLFKFNITVTTEVEKGQFFYVGGPEKTAGGFLADANGYYPFLDLSGSIWLRTIAYSSPNAVGDDGVGLENTGLFGNNRTNEATSSEGNPIGFAVFSGHTLDNSSVPLDVIFVGQTAAGAPNMNATNIGTIYYNDNGTINGLRVPATDYYTGGYFGDANNKHVFPFQPGENLALFLKLGGVFNTDNNTWTTPRTGNYVQLYLTTVPSGTPNASSYRAGLVTLGMIEGNAPGPNGGAGIEPTKLISPLPVSLTSFTAKANKIGNVDLAWTTASEQNNSHFEVNRSTDGANFNTIDKVNGNGTTATVNNYSYTDNSPAAGVNYYQLKQIDFDGKSTLSKVVSAKVGLNQSNIKVLANKTSITVNYQALANGKASFTVYSVSGAKLATVQQNVNVGANQLSIPVQLGNSLHLLKVVQGSESVSVKF